MSSPITIAPDTVLARGRDHVEAEMAGQTVMMSVARGNYYALEGSARRIWELLAEPRRAGEIVEILVSEYDVDRETCARETMAFLTTLLAEGLLREAEAEP